MVHPEDALVAAAAMMASRRLEYVDIAYLKQLAKTAKSEVVYVHESGDECRVFDCGLLFIEVRACVS
jgi:hypothetical protein